METLRREAGALGWLIRMALIGYRDQGDEYVVKTRNMSGDLQGLYGDLVRFCADGGANVGNRRRDTPHRPNPDIASGSRVRAICWLIQATAPLRLQ